MIAIYKTAAYQEQTLSSLRSSSCSSFFVESLFSFLKATISIFLCSGYSASQLLGNLFCLLWSSQIVYWPGIGFLRNLREIVFWSFASVSTRQFPDFKEFAWFDSTSLLFCDSKHITTVGQRRLTKNWSFKISVTRPALGASQVRRVKYEPAGSCNLFSAPKTIW